MKTLTLEMLLVTFLWPSIYVGCMPFHFRQNFQRESFHRQRHHHRHHHRHNHRCPDHFLKKEKNSAIVLKKDSNVKPKIQQKIMTM